ncbi:MarR family winged helix-turn-helix transcriptional regulator [Luteimicrobium sp. DT211]|uniref:MarR family winged helix-turn-helix transcriptional regulator n=1 Tax=Luteimicrobium sp. DT211 TaxID=3393412 RepID=UPI003CF3BCCC
MLYNSETIDADPDDLAERLRSAVGRFVRAARSRADTVPASQGETLRRLDREGPQTIADLARFRGVSHQAVSRAVAELERAGLVARAVNPHDARGYVLALADAGRAAVETDRLARGAVIADAIGSVLSPRERELLGAVPALLDALSAELTRAP